MASGVKVKDDVVTAFDNLKKHHKRKFCIFRLADDQKEVIVEKEACCESTDDKFECFYEFLHELPERECRYGVFEYANRMDTDGKAVEKVVFVSWAPENAPVKSKMVHASTLAAVKQKLQVSDCIQATEMSELEEDTICDKMRIKLDKKQLEEQKKCHRHHHMQEQQISQ